MAITVTSDLTTISAADSTTDGGTYYRLNGVNSGNPAAEPDAKIQNTNCVAFKCGASSGTTDTGGHFNHTTTFDLTNKHIFHWRLSVTPGNMNSKANRGVCLGLTNTSTTSTTTWSTTNYKLWFLEGSDSDTIGGWKCYVVNPAGTPDASAGTLTLSSVKNIGFIYRQLSGVNTSLNNAMVDIIRAGTGLTATASSAGDTISFNSLFSVDSTNANAWGIITQTAGIWYGAGKMTVGATGQANTCLFKDTNAVLVWKNYPVDVAFYEIILLGASGQATTFQLGNKDGSNNTSDGCIIRGQGTAVWTLTCNTNTIFKSYSSSFANIRSATLTSNSEIRNCNFTSCGTIEVNGATITGSQFLAPSATQLKIDTTSEMSAVTNNIFTSSGTGHAIQITAVGSYSLTNLTFNNYASADGSTGNEAIYVSASSGSVTINVTGGTTPSIRTAGATVTVVSGSVTISVTAQTTSGTAIQNANVFLKATSGGNLPADVTVTISNSGTTATVTHSSHGLSTNDKVYIHGASLAANNGVFSITKIDANSYSYTMSSSPGSNPTGTIKATFVFLYGLTNASGVISMSRVIPANQPVIGWARKSSTTPLYKTGPIAGTVSSSSNTSFSSILISDE